MSHNTLPSNTHSSQHLPDCLSDMTALATSSSALGAPSASLVGGIESPALGDQHLALLGMCYGVMPL